MSFLENCFTNTQLMTRVLFICHGNICRSPMAEFVMRDLVEKAGLFRVTRHVLAPDPEAFITEPVIPAQRWKDLRTEPHGKRLP